MLKISLDMIESIHFNKKFAENRCNKYDIISITCTMLYDKGSRLVHHLKVAVFGRLSLFILHWNLSPIE